MAIGIGLLFWSQWRSARKEQREHVEALTALAAGLGGTVSHAENAGALPSVLTFEDGLFYATMPYRISPEALPKMLEVVLGLLERIPGGRTGRRRATLTVQPEKNRHDTRKPPTHHSGSGALLCSAYRKSRPKS